MGQRSPTNGTISEKGRRRIFRSSCVTRHLYVFSTLQLLLCLGCARLPDTHAFFGPSRGLQNIFAHQSDESITNGISYPILLAEVRQKLDPIRNREEVNTTEASNSGKIETSDGSAIPEAADSASGPVGENADDIETDDEDQVDPLDPTQNSDSIEIADAMFLSEIGNSTPTFVDPTMNTTEALGMNQTVASTIDSSSSTGAPTSVENTVVIVINSSFIVSTNETTWTRQSDALDGAPAAAIDGLTTAFSRMAASVVEVNASNETNASFDSEIDWVDNITITNNSSMTEANNHTQQGTAIARLRSRSGRHSGGRQLLRKLLNYTVEYDVASAVLVGMRPLGECPGSVTPPSSNVCLVTFGQYAVVVDTPEGSKLVYSMLLHETQAAIADGLLQQQLEEADPDSIFTVEGASEFVEMPPLDIPDESIETAVPDDNGNTNRNNTDQAKNDSESGGGLDGVMLGLVIAISVTAFIVFVLLAVFMYLKLSSNPSMGGKNFNNNEGDDNSARDLENPSVASAVGSPPKDGEDSGNDTDCQSPLSSPLVGKDSNLPSNAKKRGYRRRVVELVQEHCPEEIDNVDQMLHQFQGREIALISMLENMDEVERELEKEQGRNTADCSDDDWSDELDAAKDFPAASSKSNNREEAKEEVQEVGLGSKDRLKPIS